MLLSVVRVMVVILDSVDAAVVEVMVVILDSVDAAVVGVKVVMLDSVDVVASGVDGVSMPVDVIYICCSSGLGTRVRRSMCVE